MTDVFSERFRLIDPSNTRSTKLPQSSHKIRNEDFNLLAMSKAYFKSPNRVCAFTYKNEKDLPPGQRLRICSRCRETCYVDRESQLAHWPIHKKVCCPIERDQEVQDRSQGSESITETLVVLHQLLMSYSESTPSKLRGRLVLYCFQQVMSYFQSEFEDYRVDFEREKSFLYSIQFALLRMEASQIQELWAVPGFANFFLSDGVFLTPAMQALKERGSEEGHKHKVFNSEEAFVSAFLASREDQKYLSPVTCGILTSVFLGTTFKHSNVSYVDQGLEILPRDSSALNAACIRHFLGSWKCPFAQVSFPTIGLELGGVGGSMFTKHQVYFKMLMASTFTSPVNAMELNKNWRKENELVPGLSFMEAAVIFMSDRSLPRVFTQEDLDAIFKCIFPFNGECMLAPPWSLISLHERLELLNMTHGETCQLPASFKDRITTWAIGISTSNLLKLYDLVTDPKKKCHVAKKGTLRLLKNSRNGVLKIEWSRAVVYLECVEPLYHARMASLGYDPLPFPTDVIELILEYSLLPSLSLIFR